MEIGMFGKVITFLFILTLSGCFPVPEVSIQSELQQCQPTQSFSPTLAKVTLAGSVIFSNAKSDYYFNLQENSWTCSIPNSQVISIFKGPDASTLVGAVVGQKNNAQDVVKSQLDFDGGANFRFFVDEKCASLGLSYIFQINSSKDELIYGCQINPQVSSAIMWKQTGAGPFIDLAYLPFYQPFVDRLYTVN